jgi:hypothetical protein
MFSRCSVHTRLPATCGAKWIIQHLLRVLTSQALKNEMESLSRWLCSFKADTVRIQLHTQTVTCGERVLLCSINLTNPTSKFTDYHENKTTALYSNRKSQVLDCKFDIRKINSRTLDVYCFAKRAGDATVRLDLGKWYQFESAAYYCKYTNFYWIFYNFKTVLPIE